MPGVTLRQLCLLMMVLHKDVIGYATRLRTFAGNEGWGLDNSIRTYALQYYVGLGNAKPRQ
ncbi:MAG: hypothetical protein KME25_23440 [Symplocastrum torsivum CPER-KK1]|uniref:Uncharacterized protein n=1 Tax=Symplocastrum torsivum CPER-KK1 TaxID=450513 RepID=A0A951PQH6_9CYAN|nr:hypothetical protein [Symplocastrum torsivum CPER-KK1]